MESERKGNYGPQIAAAKLFRKTSSKGTTYFVGRMGGVKVALLKSKDVADDGSEIWTLMLSEAPQKPRQDAQRDYQAPPAKPPEQQSYRGMLNDEIPF